MEKDQFSFTATENCVFCLNYKCYVTVLGGTVDQWLALSPHSESSNPLASLGRSVRSLHVLPVLELPGTDNGWMEVTVTLGMQRLFSLT